MRNFDKAKPKVGVERRVSSTESLPRKIDSRPIISAVFDRYDEKIHSLRLNVHPETNCFLVKELERIFSITPMKKWMGDDKSKKCSSGETVSNRAAVSNRQVFESIMSFFISPGETLECRGNIDYNKMQVVYDIAGAEGLIEPTTVSFLLHENRVEVGLSTWHIQPLLYHLFSSFEYELIRPLAMAMKDSRSAVWQDTKALMSSQERFDLTSQVANLRKNMPGYLSDAVKAGSIDWATVYQKDPVLIGQATTVPQRQQQLMSLAIGLSINDRIPCQEQRKEIMDCFLFNLYGCTLKAYDQKKPTVSEESLERFMDVIAGWTKDLGQKTIAEQMATFEVIKVFSEAALPKVQDQKKPAVEGEVSAEKISSLLSKKSLICSITEGLLSQQGIPVTSSIIENKVDDLFVKHSASSHENKKKAQEPGGDTRLYEKRRKEKQQERQQKKELALREAEASVKQKQEEINKAKQQRRQNNAFLSPNRKEVYSRQFDKENGKQGQVLGPLKDELIIILKEAQRVFSMYYHACVNKLTNQRLIPGKKGFSLSFVSSPDAFTRDMHACLQQLEETGEELPFQYIRTVEKVLHEFKNKADTKMRGLPEAGGVREQFRDDLKCDLDGLVNKANGIMKAKKLSVSSPKILSALKK